MKNDKLILIIARESGTKSVSKQNLRLVDGKPLLYFVLKTALSCKGCFTVVSTDSKEIIEYSKFYRAAFLERPKKLTYDETKLEDIAIDALKKLNKNGLQFKKCLIIHPHFPLIKKDTINKFFKNLNDKVSVLYGYEIESELDDHFGILDKKCILNEIQKKTVRIKKIVSFDCKKLIEKKGFGKIKYGLGIARDEIFSPNNYHDFASLESIIKRKKILVRVDADVNIGLGHVYNMLTILNNIRKEDILIVMNSKKNLGSKKFKDHLYNVTFFSDQKTFWRIIKDFKPDMIFNDILNTSPNYMIKLKKKGIFVVNFEDLGMGRKYSDLVFNPIFENTNRKNNEYYGSDFACVREEFRVFKKNDFRENIQKIAITLGGVDKNNNTYKVLSIINEFQLLKDVKIHIILGLGFKFKKKIDSLIAQMKLGGYDISVIQKVDLITKYLVDCDFVITSNGRTVFEVASLNIPTISLSVNERERQHNFVQKAKVGIQVDLNGKKSKEVLKSSIESMMNHEIRVKMVRNLEKKDLRKGIDRVISKIFSQFEIVRSFET